MSSIVHFLSTVWLQLQFLHFWLTSADDPMPFRHRPLRRSFGAAESRISFDSLPVNGGDYFPKRNACPGQSVFRRKYCNRLVENRPQMCFFGSDYQKKRCCRTCWEYFGWELERDMVCIQDDPLVDCPRFRAFCIVGEETVKKEWVFPRVFVEAHCCQTCARFQRLRRLHRKRNRTRNIIKNWSS